MPWHRPTVDQTIAAHFLLLLYQTCSSVLSDIQHLMNTLFFISVYILSVGLKSRLLLGHCRTLTLLSARKFIYTFGRWQRWHLRIRICIFSLSDNELPYRIAFTVVPHSRNSPATPFFVNLSLLLVGGKGGICGYAFAFLAYPTTS